MYQITSFSQIKNQLQSVLDCIHQMTASTYRDALVEIDLTRKACRIRDRNQAKALPRYLSSYLTATGQNHIADTVQQAYRLKENLSTNTFMRPQTKMPDTGLLFYYN